jgi:thiol-disulfide isomerase/thioredoxin
MSFLSIILASAGMTIAMAGPDDAHCPLCAKKDKTPAIEAKAYESASWPAHNPERNLYSNNFQGKAMPLALGKEVVLSEGMTLEDAKGKVMIIDFWATWCGPCIAAVPKLADLQEKHEDNLMVVGVSGLSEDQNTVESFLAEKKEPFLQLYDPEMKVFGEFKSTGIPLVLVVSTDGVIRWMGNPHDREFKSAVEQVIKADPMIQAKG